MSPKSIPVNESETLDDFRNWIIKESVGNESGAHILVPEADQDYNQYDMCIAEPWCGFVDNGVEAGNEFNMHVTEGLQADTSEIEAGSLFTVFGQAIYYNPDTKVYTDTTIAGIFLVGHVIIPTNGDGVMRFEKIRFVVEGEGS